MHVEIDSVQRRRFLRCAVPAAAAMLALPAASVAQTLPDVVRILHGYSAGGSVDVMSRSLAERVTGRLARNAIVENRQGAAGRLAVEALRNSPADGLTILVTPGSVVTMYPHIYSKLSYDVFADLAPVGIVGATTFALAIGPAVPASVRTLDEFVAWCKLNPAAANCGNAGAGSFPHFMAMLLAKETGLALTHVPFKGGLLSMQAAAGGQVAAALATEASALPLEQAGRLRVIATTGTERSAWFAQAPTFRELGYPQLAQREWFAAFMPAKAPAAAIASASDAMRAALGEPEVQALWRKTGLHPDSSTPAELQRAMRTEHDFWGPIIRASGFTPEA